MILSATEDLGITSVVFVGFLVLCMRYALSTPNTMLRQIFPYLTSLSSSIPISTYLCLPVPIICPYLSLPI